MQRIECPMCRKELVETPEEEEDDDEEYEDDEDADNEDAEEDADEDADQESSITCKQMADKLISLGYTPADLLFFAIGYRHSSESPRLTEEIV